jgi:DNA-binding response OmpR family regulator
VQLTRNDPASSIVPPRPPRRSGQFTPVLSVGGIEIDGRSRCIRRQKRISALSPKEFALLELLIWNPGITFTREEIVGVIWGNAGVGLRTVDALVGRLRRSVNRGWLPDPIRSVFGRGYQFCANFEEQHSRWLARGSRKLRLHRVRKSAADMSSK